MKTFLGLDFEVNPRGPDLNFGDFQLCVGRGCYDVCVLEMRDRPAKILSPVAPDLESLEALCKSLVERKTPLGLRIQAAVAAELERRKPSKMPPWPIAGWDVWFEDAGTGNCDDDEWVLRLNGKELQSFQYPQEAEWYVRRATLETLVALCGGWRTGNAPESGYYIVNQRNENRIATCWIFAGDNTRPNSDWCGPLPLNELVKAGRP